MLPPLLAKNEKRARALIILLSVVVFAAVIVLGKVQVQVSPGFDIHIFARFNAIINTCVSLLLVAGLVAIKRRNYILHRNIMLAAMVLSALFLISYICHHLFAGDSTFGGVGNIRYLYYFILITHIILAATILPFILFTSYRAMVAEWSAHRKLARITWPIWFYVSVTGVVVYLMISPYY